MEPKRTGWPTGEISSWLRGLELERYIDAFEKNGVVADALPFLSSGDLKEIGVQSIGDRARLLKAIDELSARRLVSRWPAVSPSLFIACVALFTSIASAYEAREHDRLSVVPHISISDNGSRRNYRTGSPETFEIWISNNGAGVAKITSLTISSSLVATTNFNDVIREVGLKSIPQLHWTELEQPYYLKEGARLPLFFLEEEEIARLSDDDRLGLLKDLAAKAKLLKIDVAYESIYGQKNNESWPIAHKNEK